MPTPRIVEIGHPALAPELGFADIDSAHHADAVDVDEFNDLLDTHDNRAPDEYRAALTGFRAVHPGHVDALAHLMGLNVRTDPVAAYPLAIEAIALVHQLIADADLATPPPLPWTRPDNRPLLRLVHTTTLAFWTLQLWDHATDAAQLLTALDSDAYYPTEMRDRIAERTDLSVLAGLPDHQVT